MTHQQDHNLVQAAIAASRHAYIPYSHYAVGAAIRTASGEIFTGCNVENAAYSAAICAERTALVKAVSEGHRDFAAVAVVTRNGGSPCGLCRQTLYEFAPAMRVILADLGGAVHHRLTLSDLLAQGFGPSHLQPPA